MSRRIPRDKHKRKGRPTALTPEVADRIVSVVERGNHLSTAAALAHIDASTMYRWIERGNRVDAAIQAGEPHDPAELRFRDFRNALQQARATAEERAVAVVEQAMAGGFVTSRRAIVDGGRVVRDEDGNILYEETVTAPDGRLALQYLAKSRPDVWGQNPTQRVELTSIGAPQEPEETGGEAVEGLAARLALTAAQHREEDTETMETVDAELVDD